MCVQAQPVHITNNGTFKICYNAVFAIITHLLQTAITAWVHTEQNIGHEQPQSLSTCDSINQDNNRNVLNSTYYDILHNCLQSEAQLDVNNKNWGKTAYHHRQHTRHVSCIACSENKICGCLAICIGHARHNLNMRSTCVLLLRNQEHICSLQQNRVVERATRQGRIAVDHEVQPLLHMV